MSETKDNFTEIIAGHFHDILRASGVAMMRVDSHEKIRDASRRMALSIEHKAEQEAIKVFKRLQKAVIEGFNNMEADIEKLKDTNERLTAIVELQSKLLESHSKQLKDHGGHFIEYQDTTPKRSTKEVGCVAYVLNRPEDESSS